MTIPAAFTCSRCGKEIPKRNGHPRKRYCPSCAIEARKEYQTLYRSTTQYKQSQSRVAARWREGIKVTEHLWRKAEKLASEILIQEGFTNITHISEFYHTFLCDYIADKEGKVCAIQVTTYYRIFRVHSHLRVFKRLRMPYFALQIKPNMREYRLVEVNDGKKAWKYQSSPLKEVPS